MDKNFVFLEGSVWSDFKYKKTKDGREFATFTLIIMSYDPKFRDSSEQQSVEAKVRIMVFDQHYVDYLRKMKVREGTKVTVFGRLNTRFTEVRGNIYSQIDVIIRDIKIIKTSEK